MPTAFDNPTGHWESASLVEFNDRLLAMRGLDWTCPDGFEPGWENEPGVAELAAEATATFEQVFSSTQWVWKDPRNCLLLPFWTRALGTRPVVVLVLRNPLEVAASLIRRDGFTKAYCLALWERYLRVCLSAIDGSQVIVTEYHRLLADPLDWCERIAAFLRHSGVEASVGSGQDMMKFVDSRLRHSRLAAGTLGVDPFVSDRQRALARALDDSIGGHESFTPPTLPPETELTESLLAERRETLQTQGADLARAT